MTQVAVTTSNTYHRRGSGMDRVKRKFQEYRWIVENINALEERLLKLETDIQRMTQLYNDMPKATGFHDKYTDKVHEITETKKEINEEIGRKYQKLSDIHGMIAKLDEREQRLMTYKYIDGLTFEECAVKMFYSFQWVCSIHKNALRKLGKTLDKS